MKKILPIISIVLGTVLSLPVSAQFTQQATEPDKEFKIAKDLYQKELYSLAFPVFKNLFSNGNENSNMPATIRQECKYYYIICGLALNDETTAPMSASFIALELNPARNEMMQFHLAEYYFRKKDFINAKNYYEGAGISNLNNRQIADKKFHQAYVYFVMQQFDKAKPLFDAIRQLPADPNYLDANYYYGFICFNEKQYKQALESFKIAEGLTEYQNVIPFYLSEIYYFSGEKEKALETAVNAIKKTGQYYDLQLHQLAGHILFEQKSFSKALPYLEKFVTGKEKVRREDLYELSYCYYDAKDLPKAIEGFKQLGGAEDSLAQNSMYLLGDAYLKIDDKQNARTAFQFCAANNSNVSQKEVSLFNYAKLSYDLGYMDPALKAFQTFTNTYPRSNYIQEAKELLVNTLANTSNYKEALQLYESLGAKSDNLSKIYPRLLYGASVELINDQQLDKADLLLTKYLGAPYNANQLPLTLFWKGEIAYRANRFDSSIGYLNDYLKKPQSNGEVNIENAAYSLAYAYLQTEAYTDALANFKKVNGGVDPGKTAIQQDAFLRAADCYFMNKEFNQALKMYDMVLGKKLVSADYALYQKGIISGAMNNNAEKVSLLQSLERQYPASSLIPDANLEIANTFLGDENYQAAIAPLRKVIAHPKATALVPQAYLKLGVAYFNLDKYDESLTSFQQLVTGNPNSEESNDAIDYIRNIFVEKQKPGDFAAFMKANGKAISDSEEDSLTYRSSYLRYEAKDVASAKKGFKEYLVKFPQGQYQIEANYLTAEMLANEKALQEALHYYKTVADLSQNIHAERSSLQTARIYYFERKAYDSAQVYFGKLKSIATLQENRLEAMRGLLRCQFKAQQWKEAATNASDLLLEKGIATDDKMMANMVVAKNYQLNNEWEPAMVAYKQVIGAGKSEYAAESQYRMAEILFLQDKTTEAEKAAFDVIKKAGSYELWVAKSYVLLGDIYSKQKDWFNAEATFKSIVENVTLIDIKNEAQQKLAIVLEEKAKTNKVEQQ